MFVHDACFPSFLFQFPTPMTILLLSQFLPRPSFSYGVLVHNCESLLPAIVADTGNNRATAEDRVWGIKSPYGLVRNTRKWIGLIARSAAKGHQEERKGKARRRDKRQMNKRMCGNDCEYGTRGLGIPMPPLQCLGCAPSASVKKLKEKKGWKVRRKEATISGTRIPSR